MFPSKTYQIQSLIYIWCCYQGSFILKGIVLYWYNCNVFFLFWIQHWIIVVADGSFHIWYTHVRHFDSVLKSLESILWIEECMLITCKNISSTFVVTFSPYRVLNNISFHWPCVHFCFCSFLLSGDVNLACNFASVWVWILWTIFP